MCLVCWVLRCCLSQWLAVCCAISALFFHQGGRWLSLHWRGSVASGHDTLIAKPTAHWKKKVCLNDVVRIWQLFGCVSQTHWHAPMFSSLPASHCWCQAAVRLMQVDGIVLNWMLSFNDLSGRNLAAIFRRAQLLLCTQQSFTRDLWKEPMRSSCSFLQAGASVTNFIYFASFSSLFRIKCSYQWMGCFMPLNVQTTSLVSGAAAMSQALVTTPPASNTRSALVASSSPTAPCVPAHLKNNYRVCSRWFCVYSEKTSRTLCFVQKQKTDPACSFPALLFSWYCISSPVYHNLALTGHMAILCKSAENPLSSYSRQKNRPSEREKEGERWTLNSQTPIPLAA